MAEEKYETHEYDVVVIGAGGAGLRAAVEASAQGVKTALVCKSLLGKAHTVMAEGGIAAAMGNVYPEDNWKVHFRDTMRGGKLLNNWRMAQIHAQESPDRVLELEEWGALFDRTKEGLILQRDFGGHRYARLAHVGDRTGLEMIRTLQQHAVHKGIDVYMECNLQRLLTDGGRISGAFGYWRESGKFIMFKCKAVVLATGGGGKAWKVTSNSWEYTGDGVTMAADVGADLMDMEFMQFHPTGMVWPPSVRGILGHRRRARRRRHIEEHQERTLHVQLHPGFLQSRDRRDDQRSRTPGTKTSATTAAHPICCRATKSPGRSTRKSKPAAARPTAASSWTSRRAVRPNTSSKPLPSMYHQFKELADVDITKEAMEVGPTCHYSMGGVRVDADSTATTVPGLIRRRRSRRRACTAPIDWAATRSPTCWYSAGAPVCMRRNTPSRLSGSLSVNNDQVDEYRARRCWRPLKPKATENPYTIHSDLQECMQDLVGIIRVESELKQALEIIQKLKQRSHKVKVEGNRHYNPGWHLCAGSAFAVDLRRSGDPGGDRP